MSHICNISTRPDKLVDPVYVLTCVFNPQRFRSRWELYHKFAHTVEKAGGILYTVEIALGDREFAVTNKDNPRHLQLRSNEILWFKERAINLLVQRLPSDWKYMAWVDADVEFARSDWLNETRHLLQTYSVVQLFKIALDLDYNYNPNVKHLSFAASYEEGLNKPTKVDGIYQDVKVKSHLGDAIAWHPGFAWAMTRKTYDTVGGLFDVGILGAGDNHMAKSILGDGGYSCHPNVSKCYRDAVMMWQERAKAINMNLGYVDGLLLHHYHGPKENRLYWDRWKILIETQFNPETDLVQDSHGLFRLAPKCHKLRRLVRNYFKQRNEDALS